ncbi:hypothetical protein [uncultured Roseobacter sp.]|uniref:hypothetical protein n=1 Tax=uncultured Roseobacter sp. TaxID=114847 RepID=UPI00261EF71D|nr:hypothetical protein [uncultured Roseobacter sp.]
MADEQKKKTPVERLRDGNIKASVWENTHEKGAHHSVTFSRSYQDKEGQYRDTQSFGQNDLLKLSRLAEKSYDAIRERRTQIRQTTRARDQDRDQERER